MKTIEDMWAAQERQQEELGLAPRHASSVDRLRLSADLSANVVEEGAELQKMFGAHKRHILRQTSVPRSNISEKCADVVKCAIALAQLHGISQDEFVDAFFAKTRVVSARAAQEREVLEHDTRVACFDIDDVICDLNPWTDHLRSLQGNAPPNSKTMAMMEAYKDELYTSGRFGSSFDPVEGAAEGVRAVKSLGYRIVLITARPQWQYKRLYGDTIEWLGKHNIPVDLIFFNKDKVEAIHSHLAPAWPVLFVEDHPRNVSALSSAGVNVLMFERLHNQDYTPPGGVLRVSNWDEIVEAFRKAD